LIALGEARIRSGDRVRGKQACRAAAALSRARADAEALAQAALAYGTEITPGEVDPSLVQLLEEALDALGTNDVRLRARVAARLAAARQPAPDTAAPMALAREAIALAREVDDPETLRIVIHFALGALVDYAEPDEIAPLVDESIALATAAGDKTYLLRAHARMVFASLERGDVVRADVAIAEYEALARELPASPQMADALMMQAMRALMQGRFADADELVARARQIRNPLADAFARAGALIHDVASDLVQERADRMLARSREAPEILSALAEVGVDYVHAIFGCAHARLGELDAARRHLDAVPDDATVMTGEPQAQRLLAETAAVVGDVRRAALLESRLRKMARRVMTWGRMGMVCDAPVTRLLGLLAGAQGRHAEATASLEDALARAQAVGIVSLVPRLRLELAQELARGGSGPELERARGLLEDARREAEALGYEAIARAIDALAPRSVPLAPNEAALPFVRTSSSFTLAREGEYYTIECGGAVARLKDSLGLQLLERLVSSPGREFHVLELVRHGGERGEDSDAGELLDERAIGEYRRRLEDLRESAREAEAFGDGERRAKAEREIDALGDELARGVGLGGRQRRAGAASERARINTQRRLRDAIRRIEHQLPDLGRHLSWAVKTGVFCVYSPDRRS